MICEVSLCLSFFALLQLSDARLKDLYRALRYLFHSERSGREPVVEYKVQTYEMHLSDNRLDYR